MDLNHDVVCRGLRLRPLHQPHPGRSSVLIRYHNRLHNNFLLGQIVREHACTLVRTSCTAMIRIKSSWYLQDWIRMRRNGQVCLPERSDHRLRETALSPTRSESYNPAVSVTWATPTATFEGCWLRTSACSESVDLAQ